MKNLFGILTFNVGKKEGQTHLHTFYYPPAILIYSNPGGLALKDVIPTMRDRRTEWE